MPETLDLDCGCPRCGRTAFRVSTNNADELECRSCGWEIPAEVAGVDAQALIA